MKVFSNAFTLDRSLVTDVNLRTGAMNIGVRLGVLPAAADPAWDFTLFLQFQPGGGFSEMEWIYNIPRIDIARRLLLTSSGNIYRLTSDPCNCEIEYPKLQNILILKAPQSVRGYRYQVWHDDMSCEYFDDLGKIVKAVTDLGQELTYEYFDSWLPAELPHAKKISNIAGDSIEFSREFWSDETSVVDVTTTLGGVRSVVRIQLNPDFTNRGVQSISLPDRFDERFIFEYASGTPKRITKITTPTGLVKTMTYGTIPISDSSGTMAVVTEIVISDNGDSSAPVQKFQYSYSTNNYLGYRPGINPSADQDALFSILDDTYKYSVTETEFLSTGESVNTKYTYNRFHLLEKKELWQTASQINIQEAYEYTYPIKPGLHLGSQDPQFTLATVDTITIGGPGGKITKLYQNFNTAGLLTSKQDSYGLREERTYMTSVFPSDRSRIFQPLASVELFSIFSENHPRKKINITYATVPGVSTPIILPKTWNHHETDEQGMLLWNYQQIYAHMTRADGPAYCVGTLKENVIVIGVVEEAYQGFKFVHSAADNWLMLEYQYGQRSNSVFGGRVAFNRARQPLISYDASSRKTKYTYDTLNNLIQETNYADTPRALTTTYEYKRQQNGGFNEVVIRTPGQANERRRFNARGNLITTEVEVPSGPQAGWRVLKRTKYDSRQLPVEVREYDFYSLPGSSAPAWHESVVVNTYNSWKQLSKIVPAEGAINRFTYDPANYSQKRYLGEDDTLPAVEKFEYREDGRISAHEIGGPGWSRKEFRYDGLGRLANVTQPYEEGATSFAHTTYKYDYFNRTTEELNFVAPTKDAAIPPETSPCKRVSYIYDHMQRPWNLLLITRITVDSNKPNSEFLVGTRSYDVGGRLLTEDDQAGRSWTYTYPNTGEQRPNKVTDATGAGYEQWFDATTGVVTSRKLHTTQQTYTFEWDSFNRLNKVQLNPSDAIAFTYDEFGRQIGEATNGVASIKTLSIGGKLLNAMPGNIACHYDSFGRLAKKIYPRPHPSVSHSMEIDIQYLNGMMSQISLKDEIANMHAEIEFEHMNNCETKRMYTIGNRPVLTIDSTYSDPLTMNSRTYVMPNSNNSMKEKYSFDEKRKLTEVQYEMPPGSKISSLAFQFDEHARINVTTGTFDEIDYTDHYSYQAPPTGTPDILQRIRHDGAVDSVFSHHRGCMSNSAHSSTLRYTDTLNLLSASNEMSSDPNDLKVQCTYDPLNRFRKSVITQTRPTAISHEVNYRFMDRIITGEDAQPVPPDPARRERTVFFRANGILLGRFVMRPDPPTAQASFAELFATDAGGSVEGIFGYQGSTVLQHTFNSYNPYGVRTAKVYPSASEDHQMEAARDVTESES